MNYTTKPRSGSVLATLRALVPNRPLSFSQALRITELQASRLRELLGITSPELPEETIPALPRVKVIEVVDLPSSGASQWSDGSWVIAVNGLEPWQRQRFSIGHELWHVINHQTAEWLCRPDRFNSAQAISERLADYFSGCLHMPKAHLKRLIGTGLDAEDLADTFGVSVPAVKVRTNQIGMGSHGSAAARCRTQGRKQRDHTCAGRAARL